MKRSFVAIVLPLVLAACQAFAPRAQVGKATAPVPNPVQGVYDNHAQVWSGGEAGKTGSIPHLRIAIERAGADGWTIWRAHLDAKPAMDATWAMRAASGSLIPHRALVTAPASGKAFDPAQWAALDACTLRATKGAGEYAGDAPACTVLAPGIGASMALLPLALTLDGQWLRVRLYADQARGPDAREELRRELQFTGWAAVNGGGAKAAADSNDWHMDRAIRIGNEGGRHALHWRDGGAAGYTLALEQLSYRDGTLPVLKLSVIDDGNGQVIAYAWANPEATRIGINLGWLQVGLDRVAEDTP